MSGAVVSGYGLSLPDGISPTELLAAALNGTAPRHPSTGSGSSEALVGYPGQDAATAFAMGAVTAAGSGLSETDGSRLGALVASTTSNIDTIVRTAAGIAAESYRAVRPTEVLTIAGTQVTASLSSWFDARAFAYGSCTGNAAGLDALALARGAVLQKRADRVMVVGVETPGEETQRMIAEADGNRELFSGGAAVIVEASSTANPGRPQLTGVMQAQHIEEVPPLTSDTPGLVFVPAGTEAERDEANDRLTKAYPGAIAVDLTRLLGDAQGALGVLQLVVAAAWLETNPFARALVVAGSMTDRHIVATVVDGGRRS